MTDHLPILRRVGWLLVVTGMLDIGVMIYCLVQDVSYFSTLNVFGVAAGLFLLRGHLGAVRYVAWSCALTIAALLAILPTMLWLLPFDFWELLIRLHPGVALVYGASTFGLLVLSVFVYLQLRLPSVLEARVAAGQSRRVPLSAFVAGSGTVIVAAALLHQLMNSDVAKQVERQAEARYGHDYRYFVSSIGLSGDHLTAEVTAYNHDGMKEVMIDLE